MKKIFSNKNFWLILALGLYAAYNNYYLPSQQANQAQTENVGGQATAKGSDTQSPQTHEQTNGQTNRGNRKAPDYVYDVWDYVVQHGEAMPNYVGGRTFQNREKRLDKTDASGNAIRYQEWDVHKKVSGKNRGAERLITGSNRSAYFTKDHYGSFVRLDE